MLQGKTISGYTIQHELGMGGMAEVWLAENAIGNKAAVKLLLHKFCHDESIVARFQNEAKVMVQLRHPNIRQVLDIGQIDDRPCIVMEYLEGDDLKALMKGGWHFTDEELRRWWNQLSSALSYTHAQGVIHRDIKPSNIFITTDGDVKLMDFGIAKIKEGISKTQTGATIGTLLYMSPEQVDDSKHIGPASDIYSLAVTFVHLLTGKAPYDSSTTSDYAIRKGIVEVPIDLGGIPSEWQRFLQPYLAKNPAERPALAEFGTVHTAASSTSISDETVVESSAAVQNAGDDSTRVEGTTPPPTTAHVQPHKTNASSPAVGMIPPAKKKKRTWLIVLLIVVGFIFALAFFGVILAALSDFIEAEENTENTDTTKVIEVVEDEPSSSADEIVLKQKTTPKHEGTSSGTVQGKGKREDIGETQRIHIQEDIEAAGNAAANVIDAASKASKGR